MTKTTFFQKNTVSLKKPSKVVTIKSKMKTVLLKIKKINKKLPLDKWAYSENIDNLAYWVSDAK